MKHCLCLFLLFLLTYGGSTALAQESGPLMMKVEMGATLLGTASGAALGGIVWLTDPLNPSTTLFESLKNGVILGTFLGGIFGYYLLYNAAIVPDDPLYFPQGLDRLLGSSSFKKPHFDTSPPKVTLNLINYRF